MSKNEDMKENTKSVNNSFQLKATPVKIKYDGSTEVSDSKRFICFSNIVREENKYWVLDLKDFALEQYDLDTLVSISNSGVKLNNLHFVRDHYEVGKTVKGVSLDVKYVGNTTIGVCKLYGKPVCSLRFNVSNEECKNVSVSVTFLHIADYLYLRCDFDVELATSNSKSCSNWFSAYVLLQNMECVAISSANTIDRYFLDNLCELSSKSMAKSMKENAKIAPNSKYPELLKSGNILCSIQYDEDDYGYEICHIFNETTKSWATVTRDVAECLEQDGYQIKNLDDSTYGSFADKSSYVIIHRGGINERPSSENNFVSAIAHLAGVYVGCVRIPLEKFLGIDASSMSEYEIKDYIDSHMSYLESCPTSKPTRVYFKKVDGREAVVFISKIYLDYKDEVYQYDAEFPASGRVLVLAYFKDTMELKVLHLSDMSKLVTYVQKYGKVIYER